MNFSLVEKIKALPEIGVGTSLSFGIPPSPVELAQKDRGPDFVEYAGVVDVLQYKEDIDRLHQLRVPTLFHPSCLNLCGPWENPPHWLEQIKKHVIYVKSPWLAQDVAICFVDDPGYSIQLGYFVSPILTRASLEEAVLRVQEVRKHISTPLLLEPPPSTWKMGDMSMTQWLSELVQRTECGMLLDVGHLYAHCLIEKRDLLNEIPWDLVVEVHVAGGVIHKKQGKKYYVDAHSLPIQPEVWKMFDRVLQRAKNLKAVCYECEGSSAGLVVPMLDVIRNRVEQKSANEQLKDFMRGYSMKRSPLPEVSKWDYSQNSLQHDIDRCRSSSEDHINRKQAYKDKKGKKGGQAKKVENENSPYKLALNLLFHQDVREQLQSDISGCAMEQGVSLSLLSGIDQVGLELDAQERASYILSSLCRLYPISSALIGSHPNGKDSISQFLSSPHIVGALSNRALAFGLHLERLLDFSILPKSITPPVLAFLRMEQALQQVRVQLRQQIDEGNHNVHIQRYKEELPDGTMQFPPHTIVAGLPFSTSMIKQVLEIPRSDEIWRHIDSGALSWERTLALLRAPEQPVTYLCRGLPKGFSSLRGPSGIASQQLEIQMHEMEIQGAHASMFSALAGSHTSELYRDILLQAKRLLAMGFLEVY